MAANAQQMLSHFRLVEKLGEGGMGEVWRAFDTRLGREVAIKLLSGSLEDEPDRLELLRHEARAVAALDHPNIVTIHAIEEHAGRPFLVMELIRGRTIIELIPAGGLSLGELLPLALTVCGAVAAAHRQGVVHGDLKPGNVMVGDSAKAKILDFGLARLSRPGQAAGQPEDSTATLTVEGRVSGTIPYMSPEQIRGDPADARSDVFAIGVLLYEMAAGRRPFRAATVAELIAAILKDDPRPLTELKPELPRRFERIVGRCLQKSPERRWRSAAELHNALERLANSPNEVAGGKPSVAVLPFADMSAERDQDYFCEGIAEEILNALTRVGELRVASRTSSFQCKGVGMDARDIGERLGVTTLLDGSVRKAGDRLRITVELIDADDGCQLWSERYDRDLRDVFAIQEEIAQSVVQALELRLSPRERRAIKQVATADVRAYDYYLRGRKYYYEYNRRGVESARRLFIRAIEVDPDYALAWAGVADCRSFLYLNVEHSEEHRREADVASRRALELDPDSAEGHASRGVALSLADRHGEAEHAFAEAVRLNPRLFEALYFYARHCFARGLKDKAIGLYERATAARPEDYQAPLLMAQSYEDLGRSEEAAEARRRGVRAAEERLDLSPDDARALYMGANGLVALGEIERGLDWARRAEKLDPDDPMLLYNLACIYSMCGLAEEALERLGRAVDHGFAFRAWLEQDSNLDGARSASGFESLVRRLESS